jgi:hypothetical protein
VVAVVVVAVALLSAALRRRLRCRGGGVAANREDFALFPAFRVGAAGGRDLLVRCTPADDDVVFDSFSWLPPTPCFRCGSVAPSFFDSDVEGVKGEEEGSPAAGSIAAVAVALVVIAVGVGDDEAAGVASAGV